MANSIVAIDMARLEKILEGIIPYQTMVVLDSMTAIQKMSIDTLVHVVERSDWEMGFDYELHLRKPNPQAKLPDGLKITKMQRR